MSSLIWIASYPKSGNTWLRALFSHYLVADKSEFDINHLLGEMIADSRDYFDDLIGLPSAQMSMRHIQDLTPIYHELLAKEFGPDRLVKTHQMCRKTSKGQPFFSKASTKAAIYLVRNPLDAAISYAAFINKPIDEMIDLFNKPEAVVSRTSDHITHAMPYKLGNWSGHVKSWQDQTEIPVLIMRYEDLLADTISGFRKILEFTGFEVDNKKLEQAVTACRFSALAKKEEKSGFVEMKNVGRFFRKGVVGDGKKSLTREQIAKIIDSHSEVMQDFGYLTENILSQSQ